MYSKWATSYSTKYFNFIQVETKMKAGGFTNRSDADCSSKWRNLKKKYNNLNPPSLNKSYEELESTKKKQAAWPFWNRMLSLHGANPTNTLENVVEVDDGNAKNLKPQVIIIGFKTLFIFNVPRIVL